MFQVVATTARPQPGNLASSGRFGPLTHIVHHRAGHTADQIPIDLYAVDLGQVSFDIPGQEPATVEREDFLVESNEPVLALLDDLRLEAAIRSRGASSATSPSSQINVFGECRCAGSPRLQRLAVRLITEVVNQLDLHRRLHQPLGRRPAPPSTASSISSGESLAPGRPTGRARGGPPAAVGQLRSPCRLPTLSGGSREHQTPATPCPACL
jgi:hypothetical protein